MAVIRKIVGLLVKVLIALCIVVIAISVYFGAVLQESYKITPLTSAEMEK